MKPLSGIVVFTLLLFLSQAVHPQTLDKEAVLDRIVHAYGGERNLRRLDSAVEEWDMVAKMGNRHGTDVRSISIPDRLKVELTYPDKSEIRILDGRTGRVAFNRELARTASQAQRDAMRLQLMRLYSPLVLRDRSDSMLLEIDGDFCALSLIENGVRADYLVNMDTWRIEKVVGTLTINGTEMQFLTEYSDFKYVDGILVRQKESKYAGGVHTAVLTLRRITFNAEFDEKTFTFD